MGWGVSWIFLNSYGKLQDKNLISVYVHWGVALCGYESTCYSLVFRLYLRISSTLWMSPLKLISIEFKLLFTTDVIYEGPQMVSWWGRKPLISTQCWVEQFSSIKYVSCLPWGRVNVTVTKSVDYGNQVCPPFLFQSVPFKKHGGNSWQALLLQRAWRSWPTVKHLLL